MYVFILNVNKEKLNLKRKYIFKICFENSLHEICKQNKNMFRPTCKSFTEKPVYLFSGLAKGIVMFQQRNP